MTRPPHDLPRAGSTRGRNFWPMMTAAVLIAGWALAWLVPILSPLRAGVTPIALYGLVGLGLLGAGLLVNSGRPRLAVLHAGLLIVLMYLPHPL